MRESSDPRVLSDDAAVVDVGQWEVLSAKGGDREAFLHRLVTATVAGVPVGQGGHALLLTVKGQIVSDLRFLVRADEIRLVVPAGQGDATAAAFARYAIMDDFTIAVEKAWHLCAVYGRQAEATLAAAGVAVPAGFAGKPVWTHQEVPGRDGSVWLVRVDGFGQTGIWVFAEEMRIAELRARLTSNDVAALSSKTAEALRILALEPKYGVEVTGEHFPMEIGLGHAIDYSKGCYLGQEPIVRVRDRGHLNWRLARLQLGAGAVVAAGDRLETAAKPKAGHLTSVAHLPDEPPVALALLHVSVPVGAEVQVRHGEQLIPANVASSVDGA